MKRINKWLKENKNKCLLIYLYSQPLIDLVTSLCLNVLKLDFTIGIIIRLLFLGILLYLFIIDKDKQPKKKTWLYLIITGIYLILFTTQIIILKDISTISYELQNTIRAFYFPLSLVLLLSIFKDNEVNISTSNWLRIFIIYVIFIIIPTLTNTSFNGYTQGKTGNIGWFNSSNEISAVLSLLLPLFIYGLSKQKKKLLIIIEVVITLFVLFNLGSKVIILAMLVVLSYYGFKYLKNLIRNNNKKMLGFITLILIIIVTTGTILIPKTNFYKNMKIHLDYLEVNNISEVFTNYKVFDHFIFSSRLTFLNNTYNNYLDSTISEKLLGIGYIENYATDDVNLKTIEMDPFDIFFRQGIIGFLIYFIPFIWCLINIIKKVNIKSSNHNQINYLLSIIISFLLMNLSGHILTSPAVSIYLSVILVILVKETKTKDVNRK